MPRTQLTVYRHDRRKRALITLVGEIDLDSAPLVHTALVECLRDGIRTLDIDLTPVSFCDCSGLNVFLHAAQKAAEVGGTLRLHHPPPTLGLILDLTGSQFLLLGVPLGCLSSPVDGVPDPATAHTPPHPTLPLASLLSGDVR
ncbi:STAS domain-containing protein [Streptomyces sp. NBC_00343]|uniref:STAS domain-containing protein n=1 Tax=Streptomyces sp. NBC_00343 TaxID=2975719 RepID=UPI002E2AAE23|nr:STAS domain-containing protein [Streptomyces sp. NBC_00343]